MITYAWIFLLIGVYCAEPAPEYETVMVAEIYAAGSRTPLASNFLNETWIKNIGMGRITGNGIRQQYNLGRVMREKYFNLFQYLNTDMVEVYSSGRSRSLISAVSHNQGLFPTETRGIQSMGVQIEEMRDKGYLIQPAWKAKSDKHSAESLTDQFFEEPPVVPLHSVDQADDLLFVPRIDKSCSKGHETRDNFRLNMVLLEEGKANELFKQIHKELEKLKMSTEARFDLFGLNKLHAMTQLYDNLRCIRFEFGSLPLGFSEDIYKKLELIATGYFMAKYEFDNIVKIYTTKMSEKISEAFLRKVSDTREQLAEVKPESKLGRLKGMKYIGFSGDDDNVAAFLLALRGGGSEKCKYLQNAHSGEALPEGCPLIPAFSSNIVFELNLKRVDNTFHVRMLHDGQPLAISEGAYCPLDTFLDLLEAKAKVPNIEVTCTDLLAVAAHKASYVTICLLLLLVIWLARRKVLQVQSEIAKFENKLK